MLKQTIKIFAVLALVAILPACAAVEGKQGYAGLNYVEIENQCPENSECLKSAKAVFGKESENVAIGIDKQNGTVTYSAAKNSGLGQVQARADAQKAITDIVGDPALAGTILEALIKLGL